MEFGPLSRAEAAVLAGTSAEGLTAGLTLAEVFELRGQLTRIGTPVGGESTGLYL